MDILANLVWVCVALVGVWVRMTGDYEISGLVYCNADIGSHRGEVVTDISRPFDNDGDEDEDRMARAQIPLQRLQIRSECGLRSE